MTMAQVEDVVHGRVEAVYGTGSNLLCLEVSSKDYAVHIQHNFRAIILIDGNKRLLYHTVGKGKKSKFICRRITHWPKACKILYCSEDLNSDGFFAVV